MRTKKTLVNTIVLLIYQIVAAICGFILPRLILSSFGSNYNGIVSSITQFIGCVVLLRSGVGAVTRFALFKPLSEKDYDSISRIIKSTELFMRKIALIFIAFLVAFAYVYSFFLVKEEFDWLFSFTLVLILGISVFIENFFGIPYLIVLEADQKKYIQIIINIIAIMLNTVVSALFISAGYSIHIVKLGSAFIFTICPLFLFFYVRKKYKYNKYVEPDNEALSQRWDAFAIQVAYFVNNNTDVMVLTLFSDIREVSVYTVYHLITQMMHNIMNSLCGSVGSAFGNMFALGERENIKSSVKLFESISFSVATLLFVCGIKLIVPFVQLYTEGITDVSYYRPLFGSIICLNFYFLSTRKTYELLVEAVGHFKQMKTGAIIEMFLNICISVILVINWGLIGVGIGTLCASVFRTLQYAIYFYKYVLKISLKNILKNYSVSILEILVVLSITNSWCISEVSFWEWYLEAFILAIITMIIVGIFFVIFYKKETLMIVYKFKNFVVLKKGID